MRPYSARAVQTILLTGILLLFLFHAPVPPPARAGEPLVVGAPGPPAIATTCPSPAAATTASRSCPTITTTSSTGTASRVLTIRVRNVSPAAAPAPPAGRFALGRPMREERPAASTIAGITVKSSP